MSNIVLTFSQAKAQRHEESIAGFTSFGEYILRECCHV